MDTYTLKTAWQPVFLWPPDVIVHHVKPVAFWLGNAPNYIYISLLGKYASTWIWNLGSLMCTYPDRWHTALLEIDFMTNEICLEGSSSPSGLIYGLWHVLQGESGGCPWGLMPWLHLCSEVSSNFWSPWSPLTFICAGKEMQEKRTANRKQWNLEYLQWEGVLSDTMEHCAFAVGLTANLCNSKMLSLHS